MAKEEPFSAKESLKALGLVFGDIGTSPIYTLSVIFLILSPTAENIVGILSLIIWSLVLIVYIQYSWLAMGVSLHNEGGTLIIKKLIEKTLGPGRKAAIVAALAYCGVALLLGDGVITPAISILSAVEGIAFIPGAEGVPGSVILVLAIAITIGLFIFQSKGSDSVAGAFGPIMLIWFAVLALTGGFEVAAHPAILKALSPLNAVSFLFNHGIAGFFILSEVILCFTGAEALYADMGHLGRKPIINAWNLVFGALVLNYLGQGAFLSSNTGVKNILFEMVKHDWSLLYIPFLLLTVAATVIASQAMISGAFSIIYQCLNSGILPRMKIDFTSNKLKSQIYLPTINWLLMGSVILVMLVFKSSDKLASAYGLAVSGAMTITSILMIVYFRLRKENFRLIAASCVLAADLAFFTAAMKKIPSGGYWALILALVPLLLMILWTKGQKKTYRKLKALPLDSFLPAYRQAFAENTRVDGCALFFVSDRQSVSPYIIHIIFRSGIIYDKNILVSIGRTDEPRGIDFLLGEIEAGLYSLDIKLGYMEHPDIEEIVRLAGVDHRVIFYGVEDVVTESFVWSVFAAIKRLSPSFVKFYRISRTRLHGVITRVEL